MKKPELRERQGTMRHVGLAAQAEQEPILATGELSEPEGNQGASSNTARAPREHVKIVFFAANTSEGRALALDEEYRAIEKAIRGARHRDAFQLIPKLAVRRSDVQDALLEHSPDIVHFSCHGSARSEIQLLGDGPESAPISAEALAALFKVLQDNLALVVFNACFASGQAEAIRQYAGLAVGMRAAIEDRAAIAFASALYGALAYGRSVRDAFDLGVAAVAAVAPRQKSLPQLFVGAGASSEATYLVSDSRSRRWSRILAALGGAVVCGMLALGWMSMRPPDEDRRTPPPVHEDRHTLPPVRGMVRFAAADVHPGVFDAARRPQVCSALGEAEDCAELTHPEQVAAVHVATFDLDVQEVTTGDFVTWLNGSAESWYVQKTKTAQVIATGRDPQVALTVVGERCGLSINAEGRVVADPDKTRWPVVCVTWYGAQEYCRGHQKRLPSEVEWELAAKGEEGRPFPWGNQSPHPDGVAYGNRDGAARHPVDVGSLLQDVSPQGVHDLGGNVAEWVDCHRDDGDMRATRGGSWNTIDPCHLLGSSCQRLPANRASTDIGFRCASSVLDDK